MKNILLYAVVMLAACNANKDKATSVRDGNKEGSETVRGALPATGCYQMVIDKDSATMNLTINGNNVSGKLDYKRFQKDNNTGNFTGTIDSNRINAWYSFQAEGTISVRQVVFKIDGDKLLEGYGDIGAKGDTAYFKYPHALTYENNHPYTKIACR